MENKTERTIFDHNPQTAGCSVRIEKINRKEKIAKILSLFISSTILCGFLIFLLSLVAKL